ncbi:hypothetical protein BY996DRAFT_6412380 [Phakopsora pachyrhizi]|nr:hypothetical protein BY996DRAFT_6412380 [Phakopsora pachyrhizi]
MKGLKSPFLNSSHRGSSPSISSSSSTSSSNNQRQMNNEKSFQSIPSSGSRIAYKKSNRDSDIVIRALVDYRARRVVEMSFRTGELLQALGEFWEPDGSGWFEATNPATQSRGFVPMKHFQVFSSSRLPTTAHQPKPKTTVQTTKSTPQGNLSFQTRSSSSNPSNYSSTASYPSHNPSPPPYRTPNFATRSNHPMKFRSPKPQPLYGIVRHDFRAERADELGARRGEAIILIAHSQHEWFVAKPIGRLGGPGLIPVSFVEVKDLSTGKGLREEVIKHLMKSGIIPCVDEWKRAAAEYRGNSIPLGKFENPTVTMMPSQKATPNISRRISKSHHNLRSSYSKEYNGNFSPPSSSHYHIGRNTNQSVENPNPQSPNKPLSHIRHLFDGKKNVEKSTILPKVPLHDSVSKTEKSSESRTSNLSEGFRTESGSGEDGYATVEDLRERYGILTHASVESFHMEDSKYWFHLRSHFIRPSSSNDSGDETKVLVLYRLYEDFFDFHASLLDSFPAEAGRETINQPSIIPKLPEPKEHVDELVCAERVNGLSEYLKELSQLPIYIRESELFYEFLGPREGDIELQEESSSGTGSSDEEPRTAELDHDMTRSQAIKKDINPDGELTTDQLEDELRNESLAVRRSILDRKKRSSKKLRLAHSSHNLSSRTMEDVVMLASSSLSNGDGDCSAKESNEPLHVRGTHRSNFSSSTSASFNASQNHATATETILSPIEQRGNSPLVYRIKVFQKDSKDVIVMKIPDGIRYPELLNRVEEKIRSTLTTREGEEEEAEELSSLNLSNNHVGSDDNSKKTKLYLKDCKGGNGWIELVEDDNNQLKNWFNECKNRLAILYTSINQK